MASNKRRRHTPDQIIRKLAEGNKLLGAGQELGEVCRHLAQRRKKKRLTGIGVAMDAMSPIRPNVIWAMDVLLEHPLSGETPYWCRNGVSSPDVDVDPSVLNRTDQQQRLGRCGAADRGVLLTHSLDVLLDCVHSHKKVLCCS